MILINLSFVKACFVVLVGNGLVDITLSSTTSCSCLWILCAPSGLQNLTPGTPRFTHFYASLRSFKSGSLGIPGLWHSSRDITWSIWLETAKWKVYIALENKKRHLSVSLFVFLISDFLFVPGCGFWAPLRGFKILRQELPDSHIFVRHFVPSKMVHWGSQAYGILP